MVQLQGSDPGFENFVSLFMPIYLPINPWGLKISSLFFFGFLLTNFLRTQVKEVIIKPLTTHLYMK